MKFVLWFLYSMVSADGMNTIEVTRWLKYEDHKYSLEICQDILKQVDNEMHKSGMYSRGLRLKAECLPDGIPPNIFEVGGAIEGQNYLAPIIPDCDRVISTHPPFCVSSE